MIIQIKAIWLPESRPAPPIVIAIELHTKVREYFTIFYNFTIRAFSWLKVPSSAFPIKTLFRHYAITRQLKTVSRREIGILCEPSFEAQDSIGHCSRGAQLH